jgi:hypothetical protein
MVRAQIADGALSPGQPAPSGDALARVTGYSSLTCRRALRTLVDDGVLVAGVSRNARPRVSGLVPGSGEESRADAGRALCASLAARRRGAGLTQPGLAGLVGVSVTTVGHAETGRLWQSRDFWERADKALDAAGNLLALHDAYRAGDAAPRTTARAAAAARTAREGAAAGLAASGLVTCIAVTWADGTVTPFYPTPLS